MGRTILCSAGTSVAQGCAALQELQRRECRWDEDVSALAEQIAARLRNLAPDTEAGRIRASAELNGLQRLRVGADDEVVLFSSDTGDGRCCAEAVAAVVRREFGAARVIVERVPDLQVRDGERLRHGGLISLARGLMRYLEDPQRAHGGGCVLNTNGGYKGVVPFFTLLGMIFRAPVIYVFEFAETVITLPPLPITLAQDLFARATPAIQWAQANPAFDPEQFFRRVHGYRPDERQLFESFIEIVPMEDGRILADLSPLVTVLANTEVDGTRRLFMSNRAQDAYLLLDGTDRDTVTDYLRNLCSPSWRSHYRRTKVSSDMEFYGAGRFPWRFSGFTEGGRFHLAWLTRNHDEADRWTDHSSRKEWASRPYSAFEVPPATADGAAAEGEGEIEATWVELDAEVTKLRSEALATASRIAEQAQREARLNDQLRALQNEKELLNKELARCRGRIDERELRHADEATADAAGSTGDDPARQAAPNVPTGRTFDAVYTGHAGRSQRFRVVADGRTYVACVPDTMVDGLTFVAERVYRIRVVGITGGTLQARIADEEGDDGTGR